jgi:FOG: EAL domain
MGEIYFDISAAVILSLNIFFLYYRRYLHNYRNSLFAVMLKLSLLTAFLDMASVLLNRHHESVPLWLLYASNTLSYCLQITIALLYALYILLFTGKLRCMGMAEKALSLAPWTFAVLITLSNPATRLVFRFDQGDYTLGPLVPLLYLAGCLYLAYSLICTLQYRRTLPSGSVRNVSIFVLLALVPALIQFLIPQQRVQCLGVALTELYLLLTLQNPDEYLDNMTGLLNWNGFATQAALILENGRSFEALLLVVEDGTFLNHTFGLDNYSALLKEIACYLSRDPHVEHLAIAPDKAQFALILDGGARGDSVPATVFAIQDRFRQPWLLDGTPITLSARICRVRCPEDTENVSELFRGMDQLGDNSGNWPKGKLLGMCDLGLADRKRQVEIEQAIPRCMERNSLLVLYQPIFSVEKHRIVSAEALVRLSDPELGIISPDEFIPLAERNGTIQKIGSLVLNSACAFMGNSELADRGIHFIEINLSVAQCIQPDLLMQLNSIIARHHVKPSQICLEITEPAAAGSPEKLVQNMKALAEAGFALAIDDYGTGYSNIRYLMDLPFRYAKVDKSMVYAWFESARGKTTLEFTISMFKKMGLQIIAEGIETTEQARIMSELGCDLLQGYLFARPLSGDAFLGLLGKE